MSGTGNCFDNAAMESFYHTLKTELVHFECYLTREEAMLSIFEYIEVFYNRQRLHSTLGYMSPEDFENKGLCPLNPGIFMDTMQVNEYPESNTANLEISRLHRVTAIGVPACTVARV